MSEWGQGEESAAVSQEFKPLVSEKKNNVLLEMLRFIIKTNAAEMNFLLITGTRGWPLFTGVRNSLHDYDWGLNIYI